MTRRLLDGYDVVLAGLPAPYSSSLAAALRAAGNGEVLDLPDVPDGRSDHLPGSTRPGVLVTTGAATADPPNAREHRAVVQVVAAVTPPAVVAALGRGALGVLELGAPVDLAVQVVHAAVQGWVLLPQPVALALAGADGTGVLATSSPPPVPSPSPPVDRVPHVEPGERAWLRALSSGATAASLARGTARADQEVYRSLAALYRRLGAESRTEALLRAQRWGLLDGEEPLDDEDPGAG